ncbi:MAG: glycerol-3-phosphate dehydrogenase/oxidase [Candidatus Villigracilaceae bacterium]
MNRNEILQGLHQDPNISVLIVGGGINGIGVFRDLALNGVDVLLVERGDFCSGASAASSHMAHGGIRYLENGEFRLVREAVRERNRMIENAPHLVHPLPTTIPIFKIFSGLFNAPLKFLGWLDKPSERGALVIKLGLILYDAFTGKKRAVPSHVFEPRRKALARFPRLNPKVLYIATYYDGSIFSPERLALEILLDGEAEGAHARALNYVSVVGAQGKQVTLRDELNGETFDVRPKLVINAAGPWIDFTNRALGVSTRYIGGTKGSHIILDHPELSQAIAEHEFFFENKDGRIVLIFPLADKVMLGTSDIPVDDPDSARCTDEEVTYFLDMLDRVFPDLKVGRDQIIFSFSGVRPLPASKAKNAGQISRDHSIQVLDGPWTGLTFPVYSLVGGKWTSFRAFAEQVTDKALARLSLQRQKNTSTLGIGGGKNYPRSEAEKKRYLDGLCAWTGLPQERVRILFERYGTRSEQIAMYLAREADRPLATLPQYSRREIGYLALYEKVVHLDDFVLRRSMLAFLGQLTRPALEELAEIIAEALGWDADRKSAEVRRCLAILADRHGVRL